MTKVTMRCLNQGLVVLLLTASFAVLPLARSQDAASHDPGNSSGPAEQLYLQLRSVGLDKTRVYRIREGSLDRSAIHITLDDGTIAFTEDAGGHITGAFFEGDGEVLLSPPDRVERASMAMFTGAAILEERFGTAYFRFNDDTFDKLRPSLRSAEHTEEFVTQWNDASRNLAQLDALRLLTSFANGQAADKTDVIWHARLQGRTLGNFDLYYDSAAEEQIWAGQGKTVAGTNYYDLWSSFSPETAAEKPVAGPPEDFQVSQYKIRAEINMPTQLNAEALLHLDVHKGGRRALMFELSRFLQVKQVEADGRPIEFIHNPALEGTELARVGNDHVAVIFPEPLKDGQQVRLKFVYGGDVLSDAGGGLVYVGARGTWYPNQYRTMSNFDLEFHYPAAWTLVATGKLSDETPNRSASANRPEEQVSHWVTERPIPVAGFNLGKYERATAHAGDVVVTTYASREMEQAFPQPPQKIETPEPLVSSNFPRRGKQIEVAPPPPSPARNAQKVAESSARAVEFFSRNFGPYPYSTLSLTQRPGILSQGWPGLVFLSSFSFLSEGEQSQLSMGPIARTMSSGVIAHETAHQWWGDLVTWSGYRDQWLVEALADYSSLMLIENSDPARFRSVLTSYRNDLLQKNKAGEQLMLAGPVTLGNRLSSSHFPGGYEVISYGRGVWLFHMLRNMLRDAERKSRTASASSRPQVAEEPFIRSLRKARNRYQGRSITTEELLQVFEEDLPRPLWHEGKKSLDWFLDSWINGTAIPRFELDGLKFEDKSSSSVVVTGNITQKDAPDTLTTLIPVYAVVAGKNVVIGQVFADEAETHFRLSAPAGTRKVVLDPNHTLLTRDK